MDYFTKALSRPVAVHEGVLAKLGKLDETEAEWTLVRLMTSRPDETCTARPGNCIYYARIKYKRKVALTVFAEQRLHGRGVLQWRDNVASCSSDCWRC